VANRKKNLKGQASLLLLTVILLITIIISFMLGRYSISPQKLLTVLLHDNFGIGNTPDLRLSIVMNNIRMPRIIMAVLVGCCLSAAGAAYQGVFQNPMASPDLLGASAGAAFGAALAILMNASSVMITISAFAFSLLTVVITFLVSERAQGKKVMALILAGMMVSSLFTALTSYLKLAADPDSQLQEITYWLMGSLSGVTKSEVAFALIPMTIGLLLLLLLRWRINILTLGDDEAHSVGMNAVRTRSLIILASTLITAASISVTGMIGWVGLVVPHLTRQITGNNYKYLIPASMLFGGAFLLVVDDVSRTLMKTEIPIGILTAFIGAPFFLYLITRKA
jgi:iron complex transport system permease protein